MSKIQFLLLAFIMPEDDNIRLMCFCEAADVPCRFIKEVPDEILPFPADGRKLPAVFGRMRAVTAFCQLREEDGPLFSELLGH